MPPPARSPPPPPPHPITTPPDHHPTTGPAATISVGRIGLDPNLILYLLGAPDPHTHWYAWDDLGLGALGGVVLADLRNLQDCFAAIDYLECRQLPYAVLVRRANSAMRHTTSHIRDALQVTPDTPIILTNTTHAHAAAHTLRTLLRHAITHRRQQRRPGSGHPQPRTFDTWLRPATHHSSARPGS